MKLILKELLLNVLNNIMTAIKGRIKNLLTHKRPAFWVTIVIVILIGMTEYSLATNLKEKYDELDYKGVSKSHFESDDVESKEKENVERFISEEIKVDDLTETEIITTDNFVNTKYPLIAQLPGGDIFLYGQPNGVVLKYGGSIQSFDWIYATPRFILPVLKKYDVDNDRKDEIVCILNVGSGTGVSLYELHVLKLDAAGKYIDYVFDDYIEKTKNAISFEYMKKENSILLKADKSICKYSILPEYQQLTFKDISYGNIVRFEFSNGLRINMPISLVFEEYGVPQPTENTIFDGEIIFENGEFEIRNQQIVNLMY